MLVGAGTVVNGGQIKINNSSCKNFNTEIYVDNFSSIEVMN